VREALEGAHCDVPPRVCGGKCRMAESGAGDSPAIPRVFTIAYLMEARAAVTAPRRARLVVVRGKTEQARTRSKGRVFNIAHGGVSGRQPAAWCARNDHRL